MPCVSWGRVLVTEGGEVGGRGACIAVLDEGLDVADGETGEAIVRGKRDALDADPGFHDEQVLGLVEDDASGGCESSHD